MKDGCISKLTITETGHQFIQYKKIICTLPVLCTDKNYRCLDDVLCNWTDLDEADVTPPYPKADQWSNTYNVGIKTVDPNATSVQGTGERPPIIVMMQRTHVFDTNLQKQLLSDFNQKSKIKSQEYSKFIANKKALMTIIYGQCDEASKTKIAPGRTYEANNQDGILIEFLKRLRTVCFGSNDGGLSLGPYEQVIAVKSMNNYSNNRPHDPHSFKEQVKIKYDAIKAVIEKFPNGTGAMMELL